jgi:hypothetical protein
MKFLLCLLLATAAGVAYFRCLSLAIKWALRRQSPGTGSLMVAGFLLRYVLWGLVVLALLKLEPLGAVAAIAGFTIGRVVVIRKVLSEE